MVVQKIMFFKAFVVLYIKLESSNISMPIEYLIEYMASVPSHYSIFCFPRTNSKLQKNKIFQRLSIKLFIACNKFSCISLNDSDQLVCIKACVPNEYSLLVQKYPEKMFSAEITTKYIRISIIYHVFSSTVYE